VLSRQINGKGLKFRKANLRVTLDGKAVEAQLQLQLPLVTLDSHRKILSGKSFFADEIVPTLNKTDFIHFDLIFDKLGKIPGFYS
jgi:hypothetical protein